MPWPLQAYGAFVRAHPGLVQNLERLLHWVAWNPERFSGSEFGYEAFNAAVGLLGIYNESILAAKSDGGGDGGGDAINSSTDWGLWLAAVEQVQTLVEIRAIQMEQRGKMGRYGPLVALEMLKVGLRLALWRASRSHLALEAPGRDDEAQYESEAQLAELMGALARLRARYGAGGVDDAGGGDAGGGWLLGDAEGQEAKQQQQHAAGVASANQLPCCSCGAASGVSIGVSAGAASFRRRTAGSGGGRMVSSPSLGELPTMPESLKLMGLGGGGDGEEEEEEEGEGEGDVRRNGGGGGACEITAAEGGASPRAPSASAAAAQQAQPPPWAAWRWRSGGGAEAAGGGANNGCPKCRAERFPAAPGRAGALPGTWGPGLPPPQQHAHQPHQRTSWWARPPPPPPLPGLPHGGRAPWLGNAREGELGARAVWFGELLHVLRPLLYVVLLKRHGLRSWRPWAASLALELLSGASLSQGRAMLDASAAGRWPRGSTLYSLALLRSLSARRWSSGERHELLARRLGLARYLLRSPCYDAATRRVLVALVGAARYVPGVAQLAEFGFSLVEGMQGYYTYVET